MNYIQEIINTLTKSQQIFVIVILAIVAFAIMAMVSGNRLGNKIVKASPNTVWPDNNRPNNVFARVCKNPFLLLVFAISRIWQFTTSVVVVMINFITNVVRFVKNTIRDARVILSEVRIFKVYLTVYQYREIINESDLASIAKTTNTSEFHLKMCHSIHDLTYRELVGLARTRATFLGVTSEEFDAQHSVLYNMLMNPQPNIQETLLQLNKKFMEESSQKEISLTSESDETNTK